MVKRRISIRVFIVLLGVGFTFVSVAALEIPDIPSGMIIDKSSHPHGGDIICIPDFDLTADGASWLISDGVSENYAELDGTNGCYWLSLGDCTAGEYAASASSFAVQPNRNYYVSALIYCDFDRDYSEINIGMSNVGMGGVTFTGLPAETTNGWQRFEWMMTTDSRVTNGMFSLSIYHSNLPADSNDVFCISDVVFIEMPATDLVPYDPGDGMVFGGSSGSLGMSITDVSSEANSITVTATGARYTFDKTSNTIIAEQLINTVRQVSGWSCSKSFSGLVVVSQSSNEVVLTTGGGGITFGVQMDGLLLVTTHFTDLELTCKSCIAGLWNRFAAGHLIAMDDIGGFTVNPDIPFGTGRIAQTTILTSGLDFIDKSRDVNFISSVNPGWQIKWTISPGERLGITTFPPRPYDWEASFDSTYVNYYRTTTPPVDFADDRADYGVSIGHLWNFCKRAWGMSFGNKYIPYDVEQYTNHINSAKNASVHPINYMSMYFWYNRDLNEYINEVIRHRDEYGIEGIYSDGTPSPDWLYAYEGVRRLREVFPNGYIILHSTGQNGNGGTPISVPDIFIPAIDTYATATLRGEGIVGAGTAWTYPRFITSQYNKANCFGIQKGDKWKDMPQADQDLVDLVYSGRARLIARGSEFKNEYKAVLSQLETMWEDKGTEPDFYEAYYSPLARSLIRPYVKMTALPMEESFNAGTAGNAPDRWNVTCASGCTATVESFPNTTDKSIKLYDYSQVGSCSITKKLLPISGPFTFEYKFWTGSVPSEMILKDSAGTAGVYLAVGSGYLKYRNSAGDYINVQAISNSTWYKVKAIADTDTDTYDIYIDDNLVAIGATFRTNVCSASEVVVETGIYNRGTVYFNDIRVLSALPLDEDFDSGTVGESPMGWSITCDSDCTLTVVDMPDAQDKSAKVYDDNFSGNSSMTKKFPPLSGPVSFEFEFLAGSIDCGISLRDSGGNTGVCFFIDSGYLKYRDSSGDNTIQQIDACSWWKVEAVADTDTDTYDIYVNDSLAVNNAVFCTNVCSLSEVVFETTDSSRGTLWCRYIKALPLSVLHEGFDGDTADSVPYGWNVACATDTTVTVVNMPSANDKCVKLYDYNSSGQCAAVKSFLPLSGTFSFEFTFLIGSAASEVVLKDADGTAGVYFVIENGYLKYRNNSGSYVNVQAIGSGWYTVKAVADTYAGTYDIYVDDCPIITDATFRNDVYSLSELTITTGVAERGSVYFNDIIIVNEY